MRPRGSGAESTEVEESYRRVASFLAGAVSEKRFDSVLFTSSSAGEGTTTVVTRVAELLRESFGLRPLLVEVNQRQPAYARRFALDPELGLAAIAAGDRPARSCVQRTPSGLPVIVSGAAPAAAGGEVPAASVLKRILTELAGDFDLVLVDAPPVLEQADAVASGSVVPRAVLVVEAGRTPSEALDRTRQALAAGEIAIVAAVLTKQPRLIPEWIYRWLVR